MSRDFGPKITGESAPPHVNDAGVVPPGKTLQEGWLPVGDFAERAYELIADYDQNTGAVVPAPPGAVNPVTRRIEASGVVVMVDLATEPHEVLKRVGEVTVRSDGEVTFVSETGF